MAKPRTCPHCRIEIPIGHGYRFDEQNNMVCDSCGKTIFPAIAQPAKTPPNLQPGKIYGPWQEDQEIDPDQYQQ